MDAKPQRIRVGGDENAPARFPASKLMHQHTNSIQPASAAYQNVPVKKPIKRTAFSDLSNTANQLRLNPGDVSLAGKTQLRPSEKIVLANQEKRHSALLQPAQRPSSIAGLRAILGNVTNTKPIEAQPTGATTQTAHVRMTTKKQISDDQLLLGELKEIESKESDTTFSEDAKTILRIHTSKECLSEDHRKPDSVNHPLSNCLRSQTGEQIVSAVFEGQAQRSGTVKATTFEVENRFGKEEEVLLASAPEPPLHLLTMPASKRADESVLLASSRYDRIVAPSEPEEYWDEEDAENEEDDCYTTARSFRSRGDNTTGGAATVLFPKYNQQVRRELAMAKEVVEANRTTQDIEDDHWDTSMVAEYSDDIFEYMKEQEIKMLPNAHYMDNQAEIQWSMRSVLMDWVVQVHLRFCLLPETLFLCVNYIDRLLSCKIVTIDRLQLVGAVAIFIAAKYEETVSPSVQEIVYMVNECYSAQQILLAERYTLRILQYELGWPGPMSFLRRVSKADDYDLETRTLAKYFLEVTIMDERFVGSPPSFIAAGAHCLSRVMLQKGDWTPAHVYYSEYTYSQLLPLLNLLVECCENPHQHHLAIYEKYADKRYKRASLFVEAEIKKGFIIPVKSVEHAVLSCRTKPESSQYWKRV